MTLRFSRSIRQPEEPSGDCSRGDGHIHWVGRREGEVELKDSSQVMNESLREFQMVLDDKVPLNLDPGVR